MSAYDFPRCRFAGGLLRAMASLGEQFSMGCATNGTRVGEPQDVIDTFSRFSLSDNEDEEVEEHLVNI